MESKQCAYWLKCTYGDENAVFRRLMTIIAKVFDAVFCIESKPVLQDWYK